MLSCCSLYSTGLTNAEINLSCSNRHPKWTHIFPQSNAFPLSDRITKLAQQPSCGIFVRETLDRFPAEMRVKQSLYRPGGGPGGSRKLKFPDFVTTAQDGGKVVSLTHRPPLPPENISWYSFLLKAESIPGPQCDRKDFMSMKIPVIPSGIEPATQTRVLSFTHSILIGSGAHPSCYWADTGCSFSEDRVTDVKNKWICTSTPTCTFMVRAGQMYLYLLHFSPHKLL